MAFCSAWSVRWQLFRPSTTRIRHPTSSQCGIPEGAPLYPVVSIRLSRTTTAPTASRGHVERVATSCAMRMKYSSQEGRAFFSAACSCEVSTEGSLKCSIQPISRIAQPRHDKRVLVELRVHGGDVEVHGGVLVRHPLDARHGGPSVQARDPFGPVLLELVESRREASPGREHRVQDQDQILVQSLRQVDVVLDRLGGLLVALKAHKAYPGLGQEGEARFQHPQARAQHGDEADGAGDLLDLR